MTLMLLFFKWIAAFMLLVGCEDVSWQPEIVTSSFSGVANILQFEDSSRLMLFNDDGVFLSINSGKEWSIVPLENDNGDSMKVTAIQEFDYDKNLAMVFTESNRHFYTLDQGDSWQSFDLPDKEVIVSSATAQLNYANKDAILLEFQIFGEANEPGVIIGYTNDRFQSGIKLIDIKGIQSCKFTKANPQFVQGEDNAIICLIREFNSFGFFDSSKVVTSSDFFENVKLGANEKLDNLLVSNIAIEGPYVILTVSADKYASSSRSKLFISKDGVNFKEAKFSDQTRNWSYQILYSTDYLLYVAAYGKSTQVIPAADIYRSDTNGEYFEKIIDNIFANMLGISMISKVQTLEGVWIAAHNSDSFSESGINAESRITYDDGKNWYPMRSNDDDCSLSDDCAVHLAWLSHRAGDGKIVTGQTPGILVGIGNKGKYLTTDMKKLDTFVSRDGGMSWVKVADGPSLFSFGDLGNVIITVPVNIEYFFNRNSDINTDHFSFSLDQGNSWSEVKLNANIFPMFFMNNEDNTDLSFVLNSVDASSENQLVYTIDFTKAFSETCKDDDMEKWVSRLDAGTGKNVCVYGYNEIFIRRKPDSQCFVNQLYEDLKVIENSCKCEKEDFQCSYGFILRDGSCEPDVAKLSERYCKDGAKKVPLTSAFLPLGNKCSGGYSADADDYKLNCDSKNINEPAAKIFSKLVELNEDIQFYQYFEFDTKSLFDQEDTLVILSNKGNVFISFDGGSTVSAVPLDDQVVGYQFNPYYHDQIFLIGNSGLIMYSLDRGHSFQKLLSPYFVIGQQDVKLSFSKDDKEAVIISSNTGCKSESGCVKRAALMRLDVETAVKFPDGVHDCVFSDTVFESDSLLSVICGQTNGDNLQTSKLISTRDLFTTFDVLFEKIVGFTTTDTFMVVGEVTNESSLRAVVSVDGETFSEVKFPHDFDDVQQHAYTILDTASGELFFHLTTSSDPGKEYGALLKGNFNGTLFSTIHKHVNRNGNAFVDFEDVKSLDGLQLMNVVINVDELDDGSEKKLVSLISHNDGGTWSLLPAPREDSNGKSVSCKGCSLHLHSYTERIDPSRDTFGSASALGLLFGLGNIGNTLSPLEGDDTSLYFSDDGGVKWEEIAKGKYMWEFGDQGSVLVIVQYDKPVKTLKYSTDIGKTWIDYKFSDDEITIKDLATVSSDTSMKFLMIGVDNELKQKLINLDFTSIYQRQCDLYLTGDPNRDYEYFIPKQQNNDHCVFGHESRYLRRKSDADCFVGLAPWYLGNKVENNCPCTREDYECDYNYELTISGTCKLVKGLESNKGDEVCRNGATTYWYEPTGYRKLIGSTCEGGLVLDQGKSHVCPGMEDYDRSRLTGLSMFFIIFVPLTVFACSMAFVYDKGIRRNGGFRRFGVIRLDDDDEIQLIEENSTDVIVNKVVRFGVLVFQIGGRAIRGFQRRFDRFRGPVSEVQRGGSMGAFFNDMVEDDESDIFGGLNEAEDAREIDQLLEGEDDFDFGDFETNAPVTGHYEDDADNDAFELEDD